MNKIKNYLRELPTINPSTSSRQAFQPSTPKGFTRYRMVSGFTLIELLIVIAVLGILAVGVLVAINVTGNLNKANLAKAKTFAASLENDLSIAQVGKWSFEEPTSPSKDTSGYSNDGSWNSGVIWKNAADCGLGFGGCLSFDGTNGYVRIPQNSAFDISPSSSLTVAAWIKRSAITAQTYVILAKLGNGNQHETFQLYLSGVSGGTLRFYVRGSNGVVDNMASVSIDDTNWHHVAGIFNNGKDTQSVYVDGILRDSRTRSDYVLNTLMDITIGAGLSGAGNTPHDFFNGNIDEVAIFTEAFSSYQIQQLYAQGLLRHRLALKR